MKENRAPLSNTPVLAREGQFRVVHILDKEHLVQARLEARHSAEAVGMDLKTASEVAIAVSELAANMWQHAGGGSLTIGELRQGARRGLEIVAEDRGPGIVDVEQALEDGYSTGGGLGGGLPAVKRMTDYFEVDSQPGRGTTIKVRKWIEKSR